MWPLCGLRVIVVDPRMPVLSVKAASVGSSETCLTRSVASTRQEASVMDTGRGSPRRCSNSHGHLAHGRSPCLTSPASFSESDRREEGRGPAPPSAVVEAASRLWRDHASRQESPSPPWGQLQTCLLGLPRQLPRGLNEVAQPKPSPEQPTHATPADGRAGARTAKPIAGFGFLAQH